MAEKVMDRFGLVLPRGSRTHSAIGRRLRVGGENQATGGGGRTGRAPTRGRPWLWRLKEGNPKEDDQ
jgi:hypothetical protein